MPDAAECRPRDVKPITTPPFDLFPKGAATDPNPAFSALCPLDPCVTVLPLATGDGAHDLRTAVAPNAKELW